MLRQLLKGLKRDEYLLVGVVRITPAGVGQQKDRNAGNVTCRSPESNTR